MSLLKFKISKVITSSVIFTWLELLAVSAPRRVELYEDDLLGDDEVGEGVAVEDVDALVLDHVVVALGGLHGVDRGLEVAVVGGKVRVAGAVVAAGQGEGRKQEEGEEELHLERDASTFPVSICETLLSR